MKKNVILVVAGLVLFGIGFVSGMEYKAYQIRTAIQNAFSDNTSNTTSNKQTESAVTPQPTEPNINTIQKAIGDEITLATLKFKVNSVVEKQTISSSYGSPKVTKEGAKFVVISLDVTNTTNSTFSLSPDEVFVLVDNQKREYKTYGDTIGSIDSYLNERDLTPSVKETGFLVYEIPTNSTSYSLESEKAGTNDLYKIVLK